MAYGGRDAVTDYVVVANRLYTSDKDGNNRVRHLRGDTVSGLSEADVKRFKLAGAIASKSSDDGQAAVDDPDTLAPGELSDGDPTQPEHTGLPDPTASELLAEANSAPTVPQLQRPAKTAREETWRTYAIDSGAVSEADADGMDRKALIKAVEDHEDDGQ